MSDMYKNLTISILCTSKKTNKYLCQFSDNDMLLQVIKKVLFLVCLGRQKVLVPFFTWNESTLRLMALKKIKGKSCASCFRQNGCFFALLILSMQWHSDDVRGTLLDLEIRCLEIYHLEFTTFFIVITFFTKVSLY